MSSKTHFLFVITCVFLAWACSEESNDIGEKPSTRPTHADNRRADEGDFTIPDETGALPVVTFYSLDEEDTVKITEGDSYTAQAPLLIELSANVGNPDGYNYICEWRIWSTNDNGSEDSPLVTRFEENTSYTFTKSGGYGIKLYVTFSLDNDTIEYESDIINIVISESKLTCPDGFSPNNDSINDTYRVTAQSIVKLDADFFNRWGEKVRTTTLETAKHVEGEPNKLILWDGKRNGKVVNEGTYMLHLKAVGSDGVKYEFRKAITILTKFQEGTETSGGGSND